MQQIATQKIYLKVFEKCHSKGINFCPESYLLFVVRPLLSYEVRRPPFVVWNPFTVFTRASSGWRQYTWTPYLTCILLSRLSLCSGSINMYISSRLFDQTCRNALVYMRATFTSYLMGAWRVILMNFHICFGGSQILFESYRLPADCLWYFVVDDSLSQPFRLYWKRFQYHRTDQGDVALCSSAAPVSSDITTEARQYVHLGVVSPLGLMIIRHSALLSSQSYCRGCRLWPNDSPFSCQKYHSLLTVIIFSFTHIVIIILTLKRRTAT